jgi:hypothetical protein
MLQLNNACNNRKIQTRNKKCKHWRVEDIQFRKRNRFIWNVDEEQAMKKNQYYYKMWVQFINLRSLDQWIH